jgi:hypothetical protein
VAHDTAPPTPPQSFAYVACDIPPGMTISEFREQRGRTRKRASGRFARLRRALRRRRTLRLA